MNDLILKGQFYGYRYSKVTYPIRLLSTQITPRILVGFFFHFKAKEMESRQFKQLVQTS